MKHGRFIFVLACVLVFRHGALAQSSAEGRRQEDAQEFTRLQVQVQAELKRTVANPPSQAALDSYVKRIKKLLASQGLTAEQKATLDRELSELLVLPETAKHTESPAAVAANRCMNMEKPHLYPIDLIEQEEHPAGRESSRAYYVDPKTNATYKIKVSNAKLKEALKAKDESFGCGTMRIGETALEVVFTDNEIMSVKPTPPSSAICSKIPTNVSFSSEKVESTKEIDEVIKKRVAYSMNVYTTLIEDGSATTIAAESALRDCGDFLSPELKTKFNDIVRKLPNPPCPRGQDLGQNGACTGVASPAGAGSRAITR